MITLVLPRVRLTLVRTKKFRLIWKHIACLALVGTHTTKVRDFSEIFLGEHVSISPFFLGRIISNSGYNLENHFSFLVPCQFLRVWSFGYDMRDNTYNQKPSEHFHAQQQLTCTYNFLWFSRYDAVILEWTSTLIAYDLLASLKRCKGNRAISKLRHLGKPSIFGSVEASVRSHSHQHMYFREESHEGFKMENVSTLQGVP